MFILLILFYFLPENIEVRGNSCLILLSELAFYKIKTMARMIECSFLPKILDKTAKMKFYQAVRGYNCKNAV